MASRGFAGYVDLAPSRCRFTICQSTIKMFLEREQIMNAGGRASRRTKVPRVP